MCPEAFSIWSLRGHFFIWAFIQKEGIPIWKMKVQNFIWISMYCFGFRCTFGYLPNISDVLLDDRPIFPMHFWYLCWLPISDVLLDNCSTNPMHFWPNTVSIQCTCGSTHWISDAPWQVCGPKSMYLEARGTLEWGLNTKKVRWNFFEIPKIFQCTWRLQVRWNDMVLGPNIGLKLESQQILRAQVPKVPKFNVPGGSGYIELFCRFWKKVQCTFLVFMMILNLYNIHRSIKSYCCVILPAQNVETGIVKGHCRDCNPLVTGTVPECPKCLCLMLLKASWKRRRKRSRRRRGSSGKLLVVQMAALRRNWPRRLRRSSSRCQGTPHSWRQWCENYMNPFSTHIQSHNPSMLHQEIFTPYWNSVPWDIPDLDCKQELVNHVLLYTADGGNLDCIHPVQLVLDCFWKEDHRDHYAQQLESWFRNYHSMRNLKFMGLDECVAGSVLIICWNWNGPCMLHSNKNNSISILYVSCLATHV